MEPAPHHVLHVDEDDFPEKFHPILERLKQALNDPEIVRQMHEEDEFWRYYHSQMKKVE